MNEVTRKTVELKFDFANVSQASTLVTLIGFIVDEVLKTGAPPHNLRMTGERFNGLDRFTIGFESDRWTGPTSERIRNQCEKEPAKAGNLSIE